VVFGLGYFIIEGVKGQWKAIVLIFVRTLGLTWVIFFIAVTLFYWISGYGATYIPIQKGLFNLYIGFNTESKGTWNRSDADLILRLGDKYKWDGKKIIKDFKPIVFDRITRNWLKNFEYSLINFTCSSIREIFLIGLSNTAK
jgi:hypothetical protein